jgi:hypothetical protein
MKKINQKTVYLESALLFLLCILLLLFLDPFNIMMKLVLSMGVIVSLITLYVVKFLIIWREKPQDERDLEHRFKSSWLSYSTVSVLLFTGVIVEAFQGSVNIWLIIALLGMFLSKLLSLLYLEIYG